VDRRVARREIDLQGRRHEILDPKSDGADRRRLWIDAQLDLPGAHPRVARQHIALVMRAKIAGIELFAVDDDAVRT
jgi:hypothetical protein